ncbi:alpha/beta fold hydrolase [Aestuariirhabdus litorea]|uniref:Alpha/beta fold hydrolase n=1 Tax=Aestuariirhabdus litorea TaxID=2528527 RepID=A0A3P3VI30_9GAMM|nr:alpha/beta fold hydrolase [Aestuariirhabdus litorea]RRJ82385.1 alpha/beta fold hydrolase [Aestuariirhabdus litorea]RWW92548.1 alpha/beta fold hydrolase [Endozoicomonadaceae bacterium GTF-13]
MNLHFRKDGEGEPLLLIHGLFGSLENLGYLAKQFSAHFTVYSLDMRNHGRSPHQDLMSYELMVGDLLRFMEQQQLQRVNLLGHSMGGKVAMQLALSHPERVSRLIVADIAPVTYEDHHRDIFKGLLSFDPATLTSRAEADRLLAPFVHELAVRSFLLKNLVRRSDGLGGFGWRVNLPVLHGQYQNIMRGQQGTPFEGPTLFIKGGNSDYILPRHRDRVAKLFPHAELKVISGTGHWLHAEKPDLFCTLSLRFLQAG